MAKKSSLLESRLREIRSSEDSMEAVFETLENATFDPKLHIPKNLSDMNESIAVVTFLSRYIIAIVRDFANSPIDCDKILAVYGFLEGYENLNVKERHRKFSLDIGIHKNGKDIPLNMHWSEKIIDKSLNSQENSAIKKLAKRLEIELAKKGGVLGYAVEAEKLIKSPFPPPNYLSGKGYRKCKIKNKVFYVPLTERECLALANTTATIQESRNIIKDASIADKEFLLIESNGIDNGSNQERQKTNAVWHLSGHIIESIYSELFNRPIPTIKSLLEILRDILVCIALICFIIFMIKMIPNVDASDDFKGESIDQVNNIEDDILDISNEEVSKP